MTRAEYMALSAFALTTEAERAALHRQYYGQFVGPGTIQQLLFRLPDRGKLLLASKDPHFNDTYSRDVWDHAAIQLPLVGSFKKVSGTAGLSIADWWCITKEAARQYVESVKQ